MYTSLLIFLNKFITFTCKIFKKNGTVYPASIVLKFNKNILEKIKYPKYVIGITGTTGKSSLTALTAHILEDNGYKVAWNKTGSNIANGTTTLILNNSSIFTHKVKADIVLLEMDESYIKETFKKSTLTHLIVTNVSRDQPIRNASPEHILNKIFNSIDDKTHLIINADDALVNRLTLKHHGKITTFGIDKTKYSLDKPLSNNIDGAYCPKCNTKLKYDYYHYGHLGKFKCSNCDYTRKVDYLGTKIDLDNKTMMINKNKFHLNSDAFFTTYCTLTAYVIAKEVGLDDIDILKSVNINKMELKTWGNLKFKDRDAILMLSKNGTDLSYMQAINYINKYEEVKTLIIGIDAMSRRYEDNDISWLYDVDFGILNTKNIDRIFCVGKFRFDLSARLINAGIDSDELIIVDDIENLTKMIDENSKGKIFGIVYYDTFDILTKLFNEINEGDEDED